MKAENVEFLWDCEVADYLLEEGARGRIKGALIKNRKTGEATELTCDGIFVSVGRKPNTDLLAGQVTLDEGGYIVADETTRTNLAGVFAVGDVRTKALRQVVTAVGDGAVAAHFAEEYLQTAERA